MLSLETGRIWLELGALQPTASFEVGGLGAAWGEYLLKDAISTLRFALSGGSMFLKIKAQKMECPGWDNQSRRAGDY
ncbi:hypothetical protein [Bradyrhizobium sp. DASA03120]|uniref:hypothetical protein n=1 Tax=Bradyrhizobium sp. SMVTL-02 TaxID=3395917 RepID=UPI003F7033C1